MGPLTFTFQAVSKVGKKQYLEVNMIKILIFRSSQSSVKTEWWEGKTN